MSEIGHNTARMITFPCGKTVEILVRYSKSGWAWSIYWIEDGKKVYRRSKVTNDDPMMKTMFEGLVAEAQTEAKMAERLPVTGYAKVSVLVHLGDFNGPAVSNLVKDIKEDLDRYIGVNVLSANIKRLGPVCPDPNEILA